ncbi:hypothetical protein M3Y97_01055400 [Aphelenchoides bicaudatus]|nr:hypothetical protein M3Y97_01055400 [Aphelenchoides bicaudatus]
MIRSIVFVVFLFGIFIPQYVFAQNKIGHYVDKRALNEIEAEVEKLTPEQKEALGAFPDSKQLKSKTEKESIMMIAHWHMEHPDVFPVIKKLLEKIGDDYVGDPHAKEFFKYYLNRLGQMNQDSEQEFSAFLQDVRNEWKKLDGQAKDEIEENFYGTAVLVDEKRAELEEFVNSLSSKRPASN